MAIVWISFLVKLRRFGCFSAVFDMSGDVFGVDFGDRGIFEDREESDVTCFFFSEFFSDSGESGRLVEYDNWDDRDDFDERKKSGSGIVKIGFWKFFSFWTRKSGINEEIDFCCDVPRSLNRFRSFFDFQLLVFSWRWFFWYWRCGRKFCSMNFTISGLFGGKGLFTAGG